MKCMPFKNKDGARAEAHARNKGINVMLKQWKRQEERVVQMLLLGTGESGKSTISKQMKIIHINGFSDTERKDRVKDIRKNLRDAILTIVGASSLLGISVENPDNQASVHYMMTQGVAQDFTYTQEFYDHTEKLWSDAGIRECYRRYNEYQLIDCAKYFLDRVDRVGLDDYIPSDQDILRCRVMTNTIQRIDFTVKDGKSHVDFSVYDVGGQRGERRRWIQVFDTTTAILFVLDCSSFDLSLREDHAKNRLLEAAETFEQIWNSRWLRNVSVLVFINKIDLLDEKIQEGKSLKTMIQNMEPGSKFYDLFTEFDRCKDIADDEVLEFKTAFPVRGAYGASGGSYRNRARTATLRNDINDETIRTAIFIKRVFMKIEQIPRSDSYGNRWHSQHSCEYYYTCAVDTENIRKVLDGCRTVILRQHLYRWGLSL